MNVLLLSQISTEASEFLRLNHSVYSQNSTNVNNEYDYSQVEVIITRSGPLLDESFLKQMPQLRALIRAGVGIDNIDTNYLKRNLIPLYQITGIQSNAVAELAFGLLLNLSRSITYFHDTMRKGSWAKGSRLGTEIRGKVLGIIGLGRIGMRLADLSRSWDMTVIGIVRNYSAKRKDSLQAIGIELLNSVYELSSRADLIVNTLPYDQSTRQLLDADCISQMKKEAILVNVGRGGTIDDDALYEALLNKRIAGAAMDVHIQEGGLSKFSTLDNVILTPHIGSSTYETQLLIGNEIIRLVKLIEQESSSMS